jgi:hypothetical protein
MSWSSLVDVIALPRRESCTWLQADSAARTWATCR